MRYDVLSKPALRAKRSHRSISYAATSGVTSGLLAAGYLS